MKLQILIIALLVTSTITNAQQTVDYQKKSTQYQLEKLKIQAQFELDSAKRIYERKLLEVNSEAQDSLSVVKTAGEIELNKLTLEAQHELNELNKQVEKSLFRGAASQKRFEEKYRAIESEYEMKASIIEHRYNSTIQRIERRFSGRIEMIKNEGKLVLEDIEAKYSKQIALLELEK